MACNDKLQSCNDFLKNISLLLSDVLGCAQRILPSAPVSRLPAPSPYAPDAQIPITKPTVHGKSQRFRYAGTSKIYHPNGTAAHRADTSATPAFCLLSIRDIPASHATSRSDLGILCSRRMRSSCERACPAAKASSSRVQYPRQLALSTLLFPAAKLCFMRGLPISAAAWEDLP